MLESALQERFGDAPEVPPGLDHLDALARIATRRVHRRYSARAVDIALVRLLCACALSAPSKSDLQQRDIVIITDTSMRGTIADLLPHMPWVREAPAFLVFCANGRRVREVSRLRGKPFPNNHIDLFFNAVGDAAIALATCLQAAESIGLGGCPISEIRNHAAKIDAMLQLPEQVIPFAGLCLGWPADDAQLSPRLPLALTVHENRYTASADLDAVLRVYDRRREALQPYDKQYQTERWGVAPAYGWSEQKARQYAVPQRT
ncbi:MAG TPA: nitroreductase family protein, partial [Casimicrobiaceae bacterium]|nr:nitroreductase family protein [Casimicrobiaceae bacterium]